MRCILGTLAAIPFLLFTVPSAPAAADPLPRLDRVGVPLAHLEALAAGTGEVAVSGARFRQALHELGLAAGPGLDLPAVPTIRDAARAAARRNEIPLGLIAVPVLRSPEDPAPRTLFAGSALRDVTHRGSEAVFRLEPAAFVVRGEPPRTLEFDPDDGAGYRPLVAGEPLRVTYSTPGGKHLRFRATWGDGTVRTTGADLEVAALQTPAPDDTLFVTGTVPYDGGVASGEGYVYLAPGHASLTDPIVVLEGFDLENSLNWDELYALLNDEGLLEDIRSQGYDAVVLNFDDATELIQRNGRLAAELLQQVKSLSGAPSLALTGASMGGLVGRYALLWMEDQAIDPAVRTFLTFDTPHGGANIPLGIQSWLEFFRTNSTEAAALLTTLDRPAARQMLIYHHGQTTPGHDPLRDTFLGELAALGDQPAGCRRVAVANGSGATQDQGFSAGDQIIEYEVSSFLVDIIGNVYAVPDGGPDTIFEGLYDPIIGTTRSRTHTVSGTLPWDNAPGGSRDSMAQMDAVAAPAGDIMALHPSHCFVPTVSALGLPTTDPFLDVSALVDPAAGTGFDAVYFPATNQPHVDVTPENKAWLLDELLSAPTAVGEGEAGLRGLRLAPVAPNPVRGAATVRLSLDAPAATRIEIVDVAGRRVALVFEGPLSAGEHTFPWAGTEASGRAAAAGIYWIRARSADDQAVRPIVLLR